MLAVLLSATGGSWLVVVPLPGFAPVAVVVTALLMLDFAALVVTARRREVRRAAAERLYRREVERRRVAGVRRGAGVPAVVEPAEDREPPTSSDVDDAALVGQPEAPAERVARELVEGGTPWVPVPVPPPTYTLKATAPRPEPAPLDLPPAPVPTAPAVPAGGAASADGADPTARTPRPWDADRTFADDLDLDAVLARRRAVNG